MDPIGYSIYIIHYIYIISYRVTLHRAGEAWVRLARDKHSSLFGPFITYEETAGT
jgi:hypothetical protein